MRPGVVILAILALAEPVLGDQIWRPLGPAFAPVSAVAADPIRPGRIYAGTWAGFFASTDDGSSWQLLQRGLPAADPQCSLQVLAFDPTDRSRIYGGAGGRPSSSRACGGAFRARGSLRRWRSIGLDEEGVNAIAVAHGAVPGQPPAVYAGTTRGRAPLPGVLLRRVSPRLWLPMLGSSDVNFEVVAIAVDPRTPQTVYVATNNDGIAKTTDGGQTWTAANNGLPRLDATGQATPVGQYVATAAVAIDPHAPGTVYASTLGHGSCCPLMGGGGLYASQDGGGTWNPIMNGLIDLNVLAVVADQSTAGLLYAGTTRGVFSSNDGGGSWDELGFGLHDAYVGALTIGPAGDVLYAGTVGGVFALNVP